MYGAYAEKQTKIQAKYVWKLGEDLEELCPFH